LELGKCANILAKNESAIKPWDPGKPGRRLCFVVHLQARKLSAELPRLCILLYLPGYGIYRVHNGLQLRAARINFLAVIFYAGG